MTRAARPLATLPATTFLTFRSSRLRAALALRRFARDMDGSSPCLLMRLSWRGNSLTMASTK